MKFDHQYRVNEYSGQYSGRKFDLYGINNRKYIFIKSCQYAYIFIFSYSNMNAKTCFVIFSRYHSGSMRDKR